MVESGGNVERTKWPALGSANDAATIQANERTLLAWMRTGISLTTFGFVIARLGIWIRIAGDAGQGIPGAAWIGALFVLMGATLDAIGIGRYLIFHRALLRREPFPTDITAVLTIALAVATLAGLLGAFVIFSLHHQLHL